jgi:IclR family KDG regulon transcriptional repressor
MLACSMSVPAPAVDRALSVIEVLAASPEPRTLTALSKEVGIPLTTCSAIMHTLERRGYATRDVVGRSHMWRLTLALFSLGAQLTGRLDLASLAQPSLRALAAETGMPSHVGVLDGDSVVYLAKGATAGFVQFNTYPGKTAPFNLTALGKAIAAFLPVQELAPLLEHLTPGRGPKWRASDAEAMRDELARVRVQGYAVEDEEEEPDIACVAAPVFDADGAVVASVGVTGFAGMVTGDRLEANVSAVVAAGREISAALGHTAPTAS